MNLTDINVSFNCLIISPKVWIIRVYPTPASLPTRSASLRTSFRSLSRTARGSANAIKSNVRKTIALNDMLLVLLLFLPSLPLFTRACRSIIFATHIHVYVRPRRRGTPTCPADSAVNVCKLASPISHARRLPVASTMCDGSHGKPVTSFCEKSIGQACFPRCFVRMSYVADDLRKV